MVKVEMEYNPYLKETLVKFNGKNPRINSLVEKYDNELLQAWLSKLPKIFYDEMNGFDFDLEFSGTELDYADLKNQFEKDGIGDDLVHIFKKNNLEERDVKVKIIDSVLEWLEKNPNSNFDNKKFRFNNKELFEDTYTFIILHGSGMNLESVDKDEVSVEMINDRREMDNANLDLTPIVFNINEKSLDLLQDDLMFVMNQKNVLSEQLFFIIDSQLNADYVTRIIKDLGIDNPRVIDTLNDESIQKYMQVYPVTDYIYQSILKLREQTDALYEMLMEKKRISEIKNREVYEKINALENHINNLKDSLNSFLTKDNMEIPWEWTHEKNTFLGCIKNWRLRKTKMVGEDEIWKMANELYSSTTIWYEDFLSAFKGWVQSTTLENINKYRSWYEKGNYDTSFIPSNIRKTDIPDLQLPNFVSELIKIKKEEKFDNSNSFFGKLFGAPAPTDDEPEIQTVAYYQEWRDYVVNQLSPILDKYVQDYFNALVEFLEKESTEYENHISDLLDQLTNQKDEVSSKLSGEEKLLQDDIDWCMEFIDQVKEIERG